MFVYRRGWLKGDCPECGKDKKYGVNIALNRTNCFSCGYKKGKKQDDEYKDKTEIENNEKQRYFYNKSIEKVIEDFEEIPKKNRITIEKFEKLEFENKNFYSSRIVVKESSNYVLEYIGIDVTGLFVNVDMETGTDLGMVETIVVNLIEISDNEIKEEEARKLYAEILAGMKQEELSNTIVYKNGIKYGIQIAAETGKVTFFIHP